jgi:hypothetical protein
MLSLCNVNDRWTAWIDRVWLGRVIGKSREAGLARRLVRKPRHGEFESSAIFAGGRHDERV